MGIEYHLNGWPQKDSLPKQHYDQYRGPLVIVGPGRSVWDDLAQVSVTGDVMAVNDIGMHLPLPFKHWYSNDAKQMQAWLGARRRRYQQEFPIPILHSCHAGTQVRWAWGNHGSSGLQACFVGLAMGYEEITLCGVPVDNSGHYFDPPEGHKLQYNPMGWPKGGSWTGFDRENEKKFWLKARAHIFDGRVKSLSGWTAQILG